MKKRVKYRWKAFLALSLCIVVVLSCTQISFGAGGVKTTIPAFKVTLNGTVIQNDRSQYPLIVYKDITYFPMTYFDCRFLSVETDWQGSQKGLFISKSDVRGAYTPYTRSSKNSRTNTATVVTFPVTVNGKSIDNAKETYPLLSFRNITYFPMTWRFCVDELGWDYSFDSKNGLVIRSSQDAVASSGALPQKTTNEYLGASVTSDGDNVYYMDQKGRIIRMPYSKIAAGRNASLSEGQVMHQVPVNSYSDTYCQPVFYDLYGKKYLWYNTGGGVMGSRYWVEMDPAGFVVRMNSQRHFFEIWCREFAFWSGAAPGPDNLTRKDESGEWKSVGDPHYLYGWDWAVDEESYGGSPTQALYYDGGNYLYTLGFDNTGYWGEGSKAPDAELWSRTTGIVQIDIRDNTTVRISPEGQRVHDFQAEMETGKIYYQAGGTFYVYDTHTQTGEVYASLGQEADAYAVADGAVFVAAGEGELSRLDKNGSLTKINEVVQRKSMAVKTDVFTLEKYLVVSCQSGAGAPYHLVVLNASGKVVLKNSDVTAPASASVKQGVLYYYNENTQRVCSAKLL